MHIAAALSWIYSENWEKKVEQKDLKKMQFSRM
jgi:hypothetical protein